MEFLQKHKRALTALIALSSLALVLSSVLPMFVGY